MRQNLELLMAVRENSRAQKSVAEACGISESVFSLAIRGRYNLDHRQQEKVAQELNVPIETLFRKTV